jgi:predicted nucleic acid-binding Zn ribbon protein
VPEPPGSDAGPDAGPDADPDAGPDADLDAGADAVRSALHRARAAALARGQGPVAGAAGRGGAGARAAGRRRLAGERRSGAGPDARDPQRVGGVLRRLVAERGWSADVAVAGVLGRWDQVVGPDVAAHSAPETFADKVLTVRADSSAWATQLRWLAPTVLRRLAEEVGEGVVERLVVRGPAAPSWRRGPRASPGRGPRDTYG